MSEIRLFFLGCGNYFGVSGCRILQPQFGELKTERLQKILKIFYEKKMRLLFLIVLFVFVCFWAKCADKVDSSENHQSDLSLSICHFQFGGRTLHSGGRSASVQTMWAECWQWELFLWWCEYPLTTGAQPTFTCLCWCKWVYSLHVYLCKERCTYCMHSDLYKSVGVNSWISVQYLSAP